MKVRPLSAAAILLAALVSRNTAAQMIEPPLSPVVRADGTVSLALRAPDATSVQAVGGIPASPVSLTKDEEGFWRADLGPLDPGVYFYSFEVDGVRMIDPSNRSIHLTLVPSTSIFVVPAPVPAFYEERHVPHGIVHIHHHRSKVFGDNRGYYVYTPPAYRGSDERYPVLYLLHGYSDTEASWHASGRANIILDNLFAEGRATPMIVAMPFGYASPEPGDGEGSWPDWFARVTPRFERYLVDELVPIIDSEYRTDARPEGRAIAGLSMGGGQSLGIGLGNTDLFAWVGGFSSAVSAGFHGSLLAQPAMLNENLSLLWIGCGKDDFLYEANVAFLDDLKAKDIEHVAHLTEGAHTWPVWHAYLRDFAGSIFR